MMLRPEILLNPLIIKPLHGINPRNINGDAWWNKVRQTAYATNDYHCWACGVHKKDAWKRQWLEAHEVYDYDYVEHQATLREIVALCWACHNFIHYEHMRLCVLDGTYQRSTYVTVIRHGWRVLREAGTVMGRPDPYYVAPDEWREWHLLLDGKKYYSDFQCEDEMRQFYERKRIQRIMGGKQWNK